jgi:hypothetical protein
MMIRAILMLGMLSMLLAGAGLWFANDRMSPELKQALEPVVEQTVEAARSAPQWLPGKVAALEEKASGIVEGAAATPRPETPAAAELAAAKPAAAELAAAKPAQEPASAPTQGPSEPEVEVVDVEGASLWDAPFDDAAGEAPGGDAHDDDGGEEPVRVATAPDQEEWAHLIRRMLRIYDRVEDAR